MTDNIDDTPLEILLQHYGWSSLAPVVSTETELPVPAVMPQDKAIQQQELFSPVTDETCEAGKSHLTRLS
jgi:hypothetical protein